MLRQSVWILLLLPVFALSLTPPHAYLTTDKQDYSSGEKIAITANSVGGGFYVFGTPAIRGPQRLMDSGEWKDVVEYLLQCEKIDCEACLPVPCPTTIPPFCQSLGAHNSETIFSGTYYSDDEKKCSSQYSSQPQSCRERVPLPTGKYRAFINYYPDSNCTMGPYFAAVSFTVFGETLSSPTPGLQQSPTPTVDQTELLEPTLEEEPAAELVSPTPKPRKQQKQISILELFAALIKSFLSLFGFK